MEEQLQTLFTELVRFTKAVSPEIWAILIKQQIISGISIIFCSSISIALFLWVFKEGKKDNWESEGWAIGSLVLGGVMIGTILIMLAEGIPRLLNPDYYALMSLKP